MKAAVYSKIDAVKTLEIRDLPIPEPKQDEVLIKVRAASVNPLDWRLKSPRPGVDVAGVVERVGAAVTRFRPGDAAFGGGKGAFAEYACARESALAGKPDGLTFEQAACVPIAGLTALQALRNVGHLAPGQRVLVNGAAGGVGTFTVQIAKALGAHVTGVCSSRNIEQTLALGAERAIDYAGTDFTAGERGYDLLVDNVGNRPLSACGGVLSRGGRCVMVGAPKLLGAVMARLVEAGARSGFLRQKFTFMIAKVKAVDLDLLCGWMLEGKVTPVIDKVYSLARAAEAIAYVENGHARAKVVIRVD